jgi:hypothetical protein
MTKASLERSELSKCSFSVSESERTKMGGLMVSTIASYTTPILDVHYALLAQPNSLPGALAMVWIRAWAWVPYLGLFVLLFLVFPDGWPPTPVLRWFTSLVY